jgi:hypothetical protein
MPEYAAVIGIHAWLLFPFTPSSLDVFEATTIDKSHSRIWKMANL